MIHIAESGKAEKLPAEPDNPSPGPTLPILVITAPAASSVLIPSQDRTRIPTIIETA